MAKNRFRLYINCSMAQFKKRKNKHVIKIIGKPREPLLSYPYVTEKNKYVDIFIFNNISEFVNFMMNDGFNMIKLKSIIYEDMKFVVKKRFCVIRKKK